MRPLPVALIASLLLVACGDKDPADDSDDTGTVGAPDADGDGYDADEDCDDADPAVHPGATEICDGIDNDCDAAVDDADDDLDTSTGAVFYADADGDGFGDAAAEVLACVQPSGAVADGTDCDDTDAAISPAATEVCDDDDVDEDCDGLSDDADDSVDPATHTTFYADLDGDGYGDPATGGGACDGAAGNVTDATDCDDTDPAISPAAVEVCDEADVDEDCDGLSDDADDSVDTATFTTAYTDADGDGYGDAATAAASCDPAADLVADGTDCDDTDAAISPAATEVCDEADVDEDCDGLSDDADSSVDPATRSSWYTDGDGDGYGDPAAATQACDMPSGTVADDSDCDDGDGAISPAASEVCDGVDNDCDGDADDGVLGADATCAAISCLEVLTDNPASTDGFYYLDPDGDGADVAEAYCDQSSDGGGWTLMTWTADSTGAQGVPYPGLDVCSTLDCARGSAADDTFLDDLLSISGEIGLGHSTAAITDYQNLEDYDYSGGYDYGSLSGLYLDLYTGTSVGCDTTGFATGTFSVISGPTDYDGTTTYVAQSFRYLTSVGSYNNYDESDTYIWNIAALSYCGGSGTPPGAWLGNWSTSEHEYGPYVRRTTGARAVYLR